MDVVLFGICRCQTQLVYSREYVHLHVATK